MLSVNIVHACIQLSTHSAATGFSQPWLLLHCLLQEVMVMGVDGDPQMVVAGELHIGTKAMVAMMIRRRTIRKMTWQKRST